MMLQLIETALVAVPTGMAIAGIAITVSNWLDKRKGTNDVP